MAWTAPKTWTANAAVTSAELNEQLRDNLNEMLPGIATQSGEWFSVTQTNRLTGRVFHSVITGREESTSSTLYVDLSTVGPEISLDTGPSAFVFIRCALQNDTGSAQAVMSYEISGATTSSDTADMDSRSITLDGVTAFNSWRMGGASYVDLTPGSNTFTAKYRAGGAGTAIFSARFIAVLAL